ncbi:MAG: hypothetical protein ACFE7R_09000 [Candidatus Hodarchaeota archaeon]
MATAVFWQDFMPSIPEEGPPFYLVLRVNVTNMGNGTIFGLDMPRVTVYFNNTFTPLHSFHIDPGVACCDDENAVPPGETLILEFTNRREAIFSPDLDEGTGLYARAVFIWETDGEAILTTPPNALSFTY